MISAELQKSWFENHLQAAAALPGQNIDWLANARKDAERLVEKLPVMNRKSEAWRYSHVEALLEEQFASTPGSVTDGKMPDLTDWALPSFDAYSLVFVDGRCVSGATAIANVPKGVTIGSLREVFREDPRRLSAWFGKLAAPETSVFTALNTALVNDGLFLHIASGVELDRPIQVIYFSSNRKQAHMALLRNLIVLERRRKGNAGRAFYWLPWRTLF